MKPDSSYLKNIKVGSSLPFDLVLARGQITFPKGTQVTEEILRILKSGTLLKVSIDAPTAERILDFNAHPETKTLPEQKLKIALIHKKARNVLTTLSGNPDNIEQNLIDLVHSMWSEACVNPDVVHTTVSVQKWISRLKDNRYSFATSCGNRNLDDFIPNHMVETARFASLIALKIGYDFDQASELALAGLFHDIGEFFIEREILFRKAELTASDLKRLREHPRQSVEWLKRAGFTSEKIQRLVLRHHERHDGSGYPYNITGRVIERDDFILAFADMYCAMISARPHRIAYSRRYAMRTILNGRDKLFNAEHIEIVAKILGLYPPGSIVEMKSGRIVLVLAPPENGVWEAGLFSPESDGESMELIDLNNLAGDFIVRELS